MIIFLIGVFSLGGASSQILGFKEGDDCRPLQGGEGICKELPDCKEVGDFRKNRPPICTFNGKVPVICCPNSLATRVKAGHKAEQYCRWIEKNKCNKQSPRHPALALLGTIKIQVVGGTLTLPKDHNHMALIGYGTESDRTWNCGGSLVSAKYVLSAAHCVNPYGLGQARWARLGDLDVSSNNEDAKPVDKRIVQRITHPDYKESQVYHDIALFQLDSSVEFNSWVLPVCLNTKRDVKATKATVTGWGRTGFAEGKSDKLLEADLNLYNDTECNRTMFRSTDPRIAKGYQSDTMFCAGTPDGSKDACLGDSGGPLVIRDIGNCIKTQIGITSYGNQCGLQDSPGVYTRVSNYVGWIEDIIFADEVSLI